MNLQDYTHFNVLLRGEGLSGDGVRLYAELLQVYQEDLDGDDALDGESSSSQAGFPITPVDGTATVLGSDRDGEANGSPGLRGPGQERDPGPARALDPEEGAVLAPAVRALRAGHGGSGRQRLEAGQPGMSAADRRRRHGAAFQQAKALRLTVKPHPPRPGRRCPAGCW